MSIDWQRVEPTTVQKVGWRTVVTKHFVGPDGKEMEFDTLDVEDRQFAGVVALTKDNQVIVVRQFRPGPEKVFDEIPGGFVDKGETPEESARRELLEESGYRAGQMKYLGTHHKDCYMNATWHYFLATACEDTGKLELGDTEYVEVRLMSVDEFIRSSQQDGMTDAAAVLMAIDDLQKVR